jgi:hypothetical protein
MGMSPGAKGVLLGAAAIVWSVVCLLAVAPAGMLVSLVADLAGRPQLVTSLVASVIAEALVYLVLALVAFLLLRLADPPRWYWIVGPIGYVIGAGLWFSLTWIAGGEVTPEGGWYYVAAADLVAVTLGAYAGLRAPRRKSGAAAPSEPFSEEPPA